MSLDRVENIILILSGKGGVGKSSITTQLALSLTLAGKSVGILDVDLTGPSIPRFLGIEAARIKQAPGGWLPVEVHAAQTLPDAPPVTYPAAAAEAAEAVDDDDDNGAGDAAAAAPADDAASARGGGRGGGVVGGHVQNGSAKQGLGQGGDDGKDHDGAAAAVTAAPSSSKRVGALYAMSLGFMLASRSSAVVWRGPKKTAMVRQFLTDVLWPELDYLLVDTPPGTSDEHISVVETLLKNVATTADPGRGPNLAGAVVVTTPQAVAVADVRKELNFCGKTGVRVVGVVENMSGYVCPCCGVESKLFSKGGGKVMARDFGVPFLGELPVDSLWGLLVEEGRRPVYRQIVEKEEGGVGAEQQPALGKEEEGGKTGGDADSNGNGNGAEVGATSPREPGLLVDKYRNCSLSPAFATIARKVVDIVDRDTAVTLSRSVG